MTSPTPKFDIAHAGAPIYKSLWWKLSPVVLVAKAVMLYEFIKTLIFNRAPGPIE